jgi:hypothetical protein
VPTAQFDALGFDAEARNKWHQYGLLGGKAGEFLVFGGVLFGGSLPFG